MAQIIFPYDEPIYVGTLGVDNVDALLADNPWPFNAVADGVGSHPESTVGVGPLYPVPFLHGTNVAQPDPDGWAPLHFIVYSQTFQVEIYGRATGLTEGDSIFQIPDIAKPRLHKAPLKGATPDLLGDWRGYVDTDGIVYLSSVA